MMIRTSKVSLLSGVKSPTCKSGGQITTSSFIGRSGTLDVPRDGSCAKFDSSWDDKPSSIRSPDACVEFYRYGDCTNRSTQVTPTNPRSNLGDLNNDLRSAKLC